MESSTVPAFLSVDVEPDGFQLDRGDPPPWTGYPALVDYLTRLCADLAGWTGRTPRSLGIQTDAPTSAAAGRVRRIFDALPGHPLAQRLRFENPLTTFRDRL